MVTRHYPIPITSLRDAKDLKHNTVIGQVFFLNLFRFICFIEMLCFRS